MHTDSVSASVSVYSNDNTPGGQETVRIPSRLTLRPHTGIYGTVFPKKSQIYFLLLLYR